MVAKGRGVELIKNLEILFQIANYPALTENRLLTYCIFRQRVLDEIFGVILFTQNHIFLNKAQPSFVFYWGAG
jgi:hypothetical protein